MWYTFSYNNKFTPKFRVLAQLLKILETRDEGVGEI